PIPYEPSPTRPAHTYPMAPIPQCTHCPLAISMGHPILYEPPSTGPSCTPWLPSFGPPIALGPSLMGHHIPKKPPSTGPAHTPQLPSLGPPITPWPSPIGHPIHYRQLHSWAHP
ncbi:hypothetical protein PAXRUDRAFT_179817, partial [Paxillus rubicundulus Ve08.2h10]